MDRAKNYIGQQIMVKSPINFRAVFAPISGTSSYNIKINKFGNLHLQVGETSSNPLVYSQALIDRTFKADFVKPVDFEIVFNSAFDYHWNFDNASSVSADAVDFESRLS